MQHKYSILTTASPEKVWDLCTDVKNWKKWNASLLDAEISGRFDENAEGVIIQEKGRRRSFLVKACEPHFSFTLLTKFPLAQMYQRRMIGYHNHKTMVTQEIWMEGPLSGFWWRMVGRRIGQMMPQSMERFRELAEC